MVLVRRYVAAAAVFAVYSLVDHATPALAQQPQSTTRPAAPPAVAAPLPTSTATDQKPQAPVVNADSVRAPFQLDEKQAQRLEQLLGYWESRSGKVNTYATHFTRYEYDHVFGPKDPRFAKTKSEGIIRYASPDKGEFRVERTLEYRAPKDKDSKPQYIPMAAENNEHWICDGRSIFELNGSKKQLIQQELPPELQGKKIADGPLPFMFGAEKDKLKERYWIREIVPPSERKNEYWFDAYPKTREDAGSYQKITVILDAENFLPTALQIFPPNHDPRTNPSRTVYTFDHRDVDNVIHRSKKFFDRFISPKTPFGWKKVVMQYGAPASSPAAQTARQDSTQATRPAPTPQR